MMRFIISCILGLVSMVSFGQTISLRDALSIAKEFMKDRMPMGRSAGQDYTYVNVSDYFYVFNISNGGFIIVSSNANTESVLGYSLTGKFDVKNVPDNLKSMLMFYENEIKKMKNASALSSRSVAQTAPIAKEPIEPLLKIKWNQGNPYNMYCPEINGKKCWVGCVATAMAQIMGYYKWPDKGHGVCTYYWNHDTPERIEMTINLDNLYFDWNNMLDHYSGNETAQQKAAIANLMKACGYTCYMNYGLDGSGSFLTSAYDALINRFYYKGTRINNGTWAADRVARLDSLYNVLREGKPILCEISGQPASHAIVVDGNDGKGYFHINWGWGGSHDGFYKLDSSLREYGRYTFGAIDDYIIVEPDYEKLGNIASEEFVVSTTVLGIFENPMGTLSFTTRLDFYGDETYANETSIGLKFEGEDKSIIYLTLSENALEFKPLNIDPSLIKNLNLKDGRYKVNGIYKNRDDKDWKIIKGTIPISPSYMGIMIVNNGDISFISFIDLIEEEGRINVTVDEDRVISIENRITQEMIHVFNTYAMRVYSGHDTQIKVDCAGIYTIVVGTDFKKTIVVK